MARECARPRRVAIARRIPRACINCLVAAHTRRAQPTNRTHPGFAPWPAWRPTTPRRRSWPTTRRRGRPGSTTGARPIGRRRPPGRRAPIAAWRGEGRVLSHQRCALLSRCARLLPMQSRSHARLRSRTSSSSGRAARFSAAPKRERETRLRVGAQHATRAPQVLAHCTPRPVRLLGSRCCVASTRAAPSPPHTHAHTPRAAPARRSAAAGFAFFAARAPHTQTSAGREIGH